MKFVIKNFETAFTCINVTFKGEGFNKGIVMKKKGIIIISVVLLLLFYSCGNGNQPAITLKATLNTTSGLSPKLSGSNGLSLQMSQTASVFKAAVLKFELIKDDGTAIVVYDANTTSNYAMVSLTEGSTINIGDAALETGTYIKGRVTLLGITQTVPYYQSGATPSPTTATYSQVYSSFDNTAGLIPSFPLANLAPGDFLLEDGSAFKWITFNDCVGSTSLTSETTRPTTAMRTIASEVNPIQTLDLAASLTLEEDKAYDITISFGSKNTFRWNTSLTGSETTEDSRFEPTTEDCYVGGATSQYKDSTVTGPDMTIKFPTLSITAVAQ